MDIINEIKQSFNKGTTLIKLIYLNTAVYVTVNLIALVLFLGGNPAPFDSLIDWLAVPADPKTFLFRFWTLFSYMFLHKDFMHILFNMLWLFWFGKIFLQFLRPKQLLNVYLLGGIFGALLYIVAYNLLPVFAPEVAGSQALGASAAVMAVVVGISSYKPNMSMRLLFLGTIKLKYIALFSVVLDLLSIASTNNAGGHITHLGGAMLGYWFGMQMQKGNDISQGFGRIMDSLFSLFSKKSNMKVQRNKQARQDPKSDKEFNQSKIASQAEIDKILDKISKSGYESLSSAEKETLFKMKDK